MPLQKLQFRPGVNREGTTLSNEGGWFDADKVRFRSGFPEKIGGWAALSYNTFLGVCRSLWSWVTNKSYNLVGVGTNLKFYIENGGAYYDITPIRTTTTNTTTFSATSGSPIITVTDTAITGLQAGDFVTFRNAVSLGGNIAADVLNQEYQIVSVLSGTVYTISARAAVAGNISTTNGGATVNANGSDSGDGGPDTDSDYQIKTGSAVYAENTGWGSAPWGGYIEGGTTTTLNGAITASSTTIVGVTTDSFGASGLALLGVASSQEVQTATTSAVSIGDATITVLSTYGFASAGSLLVGVKNATSGVAVTLTAPEIITYTGKTATTFTGCTIAVNHDKNSVVFQNALEDVTFGANNTTTDTLSTLTRGADGTIPMPFPTASPMYLATDFPGWGEGFTSTLGLQLRLWSQTNFGEYLLYAERGGPPFVWDPGTAGTPAFTTRGTLISAESGAHEVPTNVYQIMVSSSSRITLAFGATSYSYDSPALTFDPMLIRWTNIESFIDWDPLTVVGSQAGSLRLSHGSEIIGAMQTRQEILVWTDSALFSLQYIGYPFIWKNELLADNISIMGPNAMSTASGVSYWMGTDKFYVYSGRVETLPCSLRQYVFDDINPQQSDQIFSGSNEGYSEVWWFYCSLTGPNGTGTEDNPNTTIDRYIIFNYLDRVWYYGTLNRTAWLDSGLRPYPLAAAGATNLLVYHEAAVDDGETNPPTAITSYIQSSDFDIGDGHNYGFVWRVIPDITFNGSQTTINQNPTVDFIVRPRYNPGAAYGIASAPAVASAQNYATQSTYNVQEFTQEVFTRIRGRQMAFRVECDTLGTQWQLGVPRIDIRPDGRR